MSEHKKAEKATGLWVCGFMMQERRGIDLSVDEPAAECHTDQQQPFIIGGVQFWEQAGIKTETVKIM